MQKAMIHTHTLQQPQMVHLDTVVSIFIAFAVACISTSIQGLISHAFRQTIGDIIVSDNSLGDIDHIVPMLPTPSTYPTTPPTAKLTARRSVVASHKNTLFSAIDTSNTQNKNYHYTELDINQDTSFSNRLDARGFFQAI
jgi:hypothetical protein